MEVPTVNELATLGHLGGRQEEAVPYIDEQRREEVNATFPITAGDLTFVLTRKVLTYLDRIDREQGGVRYPDLASVLGCLEATKLELYRRKIAPYEDQKIEQNGDVYS